MVNFPLVVSNCALKVSGAFPVSLAGSAKDGGTGRDLSWFCVGLVSSALAATRAANKLSAQSKLTAFMAGEFSMPAAKSHARNQSFFMERVMRLPRLVLRVRTSTKMINATAATSSPAPMASAPRRLKPEVSSDDAGAFVCAAATLGRAAFVGIGVVELDGDSAGGGGIDSTLAGGGLGGTILDGTKGIGLVPTLVPIMMSGAAWMTGGGDGARGDGSGLVGTGVTG